MNEEEDRERESDEKKITTQWWLCAGLWLLAKILISKHFVYWRNNDEMKNGVRKKKRTEEILRHTHTHEADSVVWAQNAAHMRWASYLKCGKKKKIIQNVGSHANMTTI